MALVRLTSTRDFFLVWFTWKNQAIMSFFLIVGVVMLFSYVYTPDYESTAKILLLPRTSEGVIISTGTDERRVAPVSIADINTEIELLTSDDVLEDTVRSFAKTGMRLKAPAKGWYDKMIDSIKRTIGEALISLRLQPRVSPFDQKVALLTESLEIEPVAMSNVILITLRAERPKVAQVVLNRLLEIYIKHHNDAFSKEEGVQFFDDQATKYRNKLEEAEKKLKQFQKQWNIVSLRRQNEANIALLAEFDQELKHIEILIDQTESRIEMLRKTLQKNKKEILITKEMRMIPSIVELERSIVPLLVRRSEILKSFTPSSRKYQDIERQIEMLREDTRNEVMKAIKIDELELQNLRVRHRSLKEKIGELQEEANDLNQKERILGNLQGDVELLTKNYVLYTSKTEDARIQKERKKRDLANVSIADRASLPVKPVFPKKILMLIISVFVGCFAALATPFLLEFLDDRLKTTDDVEDLLSLPTVSIPEIKN